MVPEMLWDICWDHHIGQVRDLYEIALAELLKVSGSGCATVKVLFLSPVSVLQHAFISHLSAYLHAWFCLTPAGQIGNDFGNRGRTRA